MCELSCKEASDYEVKPFLSTQRKHKTDPSLFGKQSFGQSVNWRLAPSSGGTLKSCKATLSSAVRRKQSGNVSIFMKHYWRCEELEIYSSLLEVNIMALWAFAKP